MHQIAQMKKKHFASRQQHSTTHTHTTKQALFEVRAENIYAEHTNGT